MNCAMRAVNTDRIETQRQRMATLNTSIYESNKRFLQGRIFFMADDRNANCRASLSASVDGKWKSNEVKSLLT
jgi:hypothetical protein